MAAGDLSSTKTTLPLATILHLLIVKLSSTNYLLRRNQIAPLLINQQLFSHVDATAIAPPSTLPLVATSKESEGSSTPNPAYATWLAADQRASLIIQPL